MQGGFHGLSRRLRQTNTWATVLVGVLFAAELAAALRADAGTIPLQEAWESLDGPQSHGPGDGLLVDHQPHNFGGFASDTMASETPGGTLFAQYVADDFSLTNDAGIRRVVLFGFDNVGVEPVGDEAFKIEFHDARPGDGLPGDVLYQTSVVNPLREWTGRNIIVSGAPKEYKYTIDLPSLFSPNPGDTIWLSIYQIGDPAVTFRWEHSVNDNPNGDVFKNEFVGDWTFVPWPQGGNNAFQLFSTPEPTTGGLFCLVALGLVCRRRGCGN